MLLLTGRWASKFYITGNRVATSLGDGSAQRLSYNAQVIKEITVSYDIEE